MLKESRRQPVCRLKRNSAAGSERYAVDIFPERLVVGVPDEHA